MLLVGLPVGALDTNHSMMVGETGSPNLLSIFPMNRHLHKVTIDRFLRIRSIPVRIGQQLITISTCPIK